MVAVIASGENPMDGNVAWLQIILGGGYLCVRGIEVPKVIGIKVARDSEKLFI